jgi:type II restriction enzyme
MAQLMRPSFRVGLAGMPFAYIPFSDLRAHCDALCRFGDNYTIMRKIARSAAG